MSQDSRDRPYDEIPWVMQTFAEARERADLSEGLMELEVWLSNGKKIHDIETIEQKGATVIIETIAWTIYVREQDVVAIATP
jgi:hypothetical protein